MKVKAAMLAALLGLGAGPLGAGSAQAQARWADEVSYHQGLPTRVIVRAVRSRGLVPVSRITRRGDLYYLHAADGYGQIRRVMIDAYSGRVVRIEAARRPPRRDHYPPLTHAGPRDGAIYAPRAERRLPPPQAIPVNPQAADPRLPPRERVSGLPPLRPRASIPEAGPRAAAVNPTHPPTPRSRPSSADESRAGEATPGGSAPSTQAATESPPTAAAASPPASGEDAAPKRRPLPRVVLPGGPLPKAERTADTRPGRRIADDAGDAASGTITGSTASPARDGAPASPPDAPAAGGMPPMQPFD